MEHTANAPASAFTRFFIPIWNGLMKVVTALGLMPAFRKRPWLHGVLIFFIMAAAPYIGAFFLIAGIVASGNGAKADNNFRASAASNEKSERFMGAQSDEEEREAYQGEAMLRAIESGVPIEDAMKVHDAMGKLYDKRKLEEQ